MEKAKRVVNGIGEARRIMPLSWSLGAVELNSLMNFKNIFSSVVESYDYGFARGVRYAKAQEKKKKGARA